MTCRGRGADSGRCSHAGRAVSGPGGILAFCAGALALQGLHALPAWPWLAALLAVTAALTWRFGRFLPLLAAAGFAYAVMRAGFVLDAQLPHDLEGRDLVVTGVIDSLPVRAGRVARFAFRVDSARIGDRGVNRLARIRLAWYGEAPRLRAGESWRLTVRLRRPRGFHNPGGFDYAGWLFRERVGAAGYIRTASTNRRLDDGLARLALQPVRQRLADALAAAHIAGEARGVIAALTLGERSGVPVERSETLRRTGTAHLLAISGLHVGLVAALSFLLFRSVWTRSERLTTLLAADRAAAAFSLPAAALYAALAGFGLPTQRALLMLGLFIAARLLGRAVSPERILLLALGGVTLHDPLALGAIGLWLSFTAVAVILYVASGRLAGGGIWVRWGRLHVALALGLAPLLALGFGQVSLVAPLANVVAVPLVGTLIVPLALAGTLLLPGLPLLGEPLLELVALLLRGLWVWLDWLVAWPWAALPLPAPVPWVALAAGLACVALLAPRGVSLRLPGAALLMALAVWRPAGPPAGEAWITVLDVGQGLAVTVRTAHHLLLFDAGPRYSARFDAGSAIVAPFLRAAGLRRIDALVVSHGDLDHRGGVAALVARFEITRTYVGGGQPETDGATRCDVSQAWRWDGVAFAFLHPPSGAVETGNNASCVLRVTAGGRSVLLTGDIEAGTEQALLARHPGQLHADVVQVPHHGSRTSSTPAFVAAVGARVAVVSVGHRNRFGLPVPGVLARYLAAGAVIHDTAAAGAIEVRLLADGSMPVVRRHRDRLKRPWHDR